MPDVMGKLMLAGKYDCAHSIYRVIRGDALADKVEVIKADAVMESARFDVYFMCVARKLKDALKAARCGLADDAVYASVSNINIRSLLPKLLAVEAKLVQVEKGQVELANMHNAYIWVANADYDDCLRRELSMWDDLYPKVVDLVQQDLSRKQEVFHAVLAAQGVTYGAVTPGCFRPSAAEMQDAIAKMEDICARRRSAFVPPRQQCSGC